MKRWIAFGLRLWADRLDPWINPDGSRVEFSPVVSSWAGPGPVDLTRTRVG